MTHQTKARLSGNKGELQVELLTGDVLVGVERCAAIGLHRETDGVGGEVGLAGIDLHAVGEGVFGESVLVGLFADD